MSRNTWINCNSWRFINKRYKSSLNFHTLTVCTPSLPCGISRWIFQKRCWCMWLSVCGVSRTKAPWRHLKSHAVNKSSWWRRTRKESEKQGKWWWKWIECITSNIKLSLHCFWNAEMFALKIHEVIQVVFEFSDFRIRLQNIFVQGKLLWYRNKYDEWIWLWGIFWVTRFSFCTLKRFGSEKVFFSQVKSFFNKRHFWCGEFLRTLFETTFSWIEWFPPKCKWRILVYTLLFKNVNVKRFWCRFFQYPP